MRFFLLLFWGALCALNALVFDDAKLLNYEVKTKTEELSAELEARTGVKAFLITSNNEKNSKLIDIVKEYVDFEKDKPYAALILVPKKAGDKSGKVDIFLSDPNLCDKDEILSPYPNTGSILPILVANKAEDIYNAALLNGFADMCERIAAKNNTALASEIGSDNKIVINSLRYFVYGFLVLAIIIFYVKQYKKSKKES